MTFMITYDLNKPGQNYSGLYEAIKSCGAWWHYLDSTWLVDSILKPDAIMRKIKPHVDGNDRVLVMKVERPYQGLLPTDAWDWIHKHV